MPDDFANARRILKELSDEAYSFAFNYPKGGLHLMDRVKDAREFLAASASGFPRQGGDGLPNQARRALEDGIKWFEEYGLHHQAKGDDEKARRNYERANVLREALAAAPPAPQGQQGEKIPCWLVRAENSRVPGRLTVVFTESEAMYWRSIKNSEVTPATIEDKSDDHSG